jgi:hypothetical protein
MAEDVEVIIVWLFVALVALVALVMHVAMYFFLKR